MRGDVDHVDFESIISIQDNIVFRNHVVSQPRVRASLIAQEITAIDKQQWQVRQSLSEFFYVADTPCQSA